MVIFFFPGTATIVFLIFLSVAHDDNFLSKGLLALFNQLGELIANPIHLLVDGVVGSGGEVEFWRWGCGKGLSPGCGSDGGEDLLCMCTGAWAMAFVGGSRNMSRFATARGSWGSLYGLWLFDLGLLGLLLVNGGPAALLIGRGW